MDFKLYHAGLYDKLAFDEQGIPVPETSVSATPIIAGSNVEKVALIAVTGDAGSYWISLEAKAKPPVRIEVGGPTATLRINETGGIGWLAFPIPLGRFPAGEYAIGIRIASTLVTTLEIKVEPEL